MNCLSCSKPIANTAKFCNFCGANQLELKAKADEKSFAREATKAKFRKYTLTSLVALGLVSGVYFGYSKLQGDNLAEIKSLPLANNSSSTYVQELIKSTFENYQSSMDCYVASYIIDNRQQRFCIEVSEVYDSDEAGDQYIYATVSGIRLDDNNEPEVYRGAEGVIVLKKFKKEGNNYKLVANAGALSGNFGRPGIAKIIPLGNYNIGWVVADGYGGMGEYSSYLKFFSTKKNEIHEVLAILSSYSDKDACDPNDKTCAFKTISFAVRQNKNQDPFYPIKVSGSVISGTLGHSKKESREYVLKYDPKKGIYNVPAGLANVIRN